MEVDADARAYEALSQHPRLADLAALARASMTGATETRRAERQPERVSEMAKELKLSRDEAATPFGNALDVLERDQEDRLANDLLWLAAHTSFDATGLLDRALGDRATNLWDALADRIRRIDQGKLPSLGRGEALVAAVALTASRSKGAMRQAMALALEVRDRKLGRVLSA